MIKTKEDLKYYLEEDAKANKAPYKTIKQKINWYINPRLRFTRNLRFYEYYSNQPQNPYNRLMALWHYYIHKKLSYKLGFTIRKNTFEEGVLFGHYGSLIVSEKAHIGKYCRIHVGVNIGTFDGKSATIGDHCSISPGVKIVKAVTIGNNVVIGANAVVNRDIPDNCIVAGIPARIIKRLNPETGVWEKVNN